MPRKEEKPSEDAECILLALYVLTSGQSGVSAPETNIRLMCERFSHDELLTMAKAVKAKAG